MSNTRYWDAAYNVPKEGLKNFNNGRFSGSAIEPTFRYKALTDMFGPCGVGWRFVHERSWYSPGDTAYYVTGHIEYVEGGGSLGDKDAVICRTSSCTGGTPIMKSGHDEVPKMSETDAIGKCCHHLGIAAGVYAGKFDGDKYTANVTGEPSSTPKSKPKPANVPASVPKAVADAINEADPGAEVTVTGGSNDTVDPWDTKVAFGKFKSSSPTLRELKADPGDGKSYFEWLQGKFYEGCEKEPPRGEPQQRVYRALMQIKEQEANGKSAEQGNAELQEVESFFG